VVVFVKDGDIQVWEEATGQTETIFDGGGVIELTLSDDGQVVAFLLRSVVQITGHPSIDWIEQSALWAVDLNGENPRELISAEELRSLLDASETDSTNIPQMAWIPRTHRLMYTGWTYLVQAEGESHATPIGFFLVDTDSGASSVLLPTTDNLRFAPAPDGQHVALLSLTGLSFIGADGSNRSRELLTYPHVGPGGSAFPSGVWTQDSSAFLITGPIDTGPGLGSDLTIWRVPVDGSPAHPLATYNDSHSDSVTFSPDGRYAAYFRSGPLGPTGVAADYGWFVTPLAGEQGALAAANSAFLFWQNLHWSPAGVAYAVRDGTLFQLCPDAAQDAEGCAEVLDLGDQIANIHWIDGTRFLYVTREPYDLYFGKLDGTSIRLGQGAERFAAVAMTCQNDAELAAGGEGLAQRQAPPDALFRTRWRLRNTGACTWDPSYRLAFLGGERLSGPRNLPLGESVPPGGEIELPAMFIAPSTAGSYQGQWQLFGPDGTPFGTPLTVDIVIPFDVPTGLSPDQIVAKISVGNHPHSVALGEGAAWVTNESYGSVSRIDPETNQVAAKIAVGFHSWGVPIGSDAIWVTSNADNTVTLIDAERIKRPGSTRSAGARSAGARSAWPWTRTSCGWS
jgi:YVTN family beta-propeller protein